jgi:hypothetical protein
MFYPHKTRKYVRAVYTKLKISNSSPYLNFFSFFMEYINVVKNTYSFNTPNQNKHVRHFKHKTLVRPTESSVQPRTSLNSAN